MKKNYIHIALALLIVTSPNLALCSEGYWLHAQSITQSVLKSFVHSLKEHKAIALFSVLTIFTGLTVLLYKSLQKDPRKDITPTSNTTKCDPSKYKHSYRHTIEEKQPEEEKEQKQQQEKETDTQLQQRLNTSTDNNTETNIDLLNINFHPFPTQPSSPSAQPIQVSQPEVTPQTISQRVRIINNYGTVKYKTTRNSTDSGFEKELQHRDSFDFGTATLTTDQEGRQNVTITDKFNNVMQGFHLKSSSLENAYIDPTLMGCGYTDLSEEFEGWVCKMSYELTQPDKPKAIELFIKPSLTINGPWNIELRITP